MVRIQKEDKDWLVKNGYLKNQKGKYLGLVVCNKEHPSRSKTYYIEDRIAKFLQYKDKKKRYNKHKK